MPTHAVIKPAAPAAIFASCLRQLRAVPLVPRSNPFDDARWTFEPKYDGVRTFLYTKEQCCRIQVSQELERQARDLERRVAEVLDGREAILDGELVSLDRQGKAVLHQLLRCEGYTAYAAYDILWLDGIDLRDQPLSERKRLLAELLPQDTGPLYKTLSIDEHGRALFGAIRRLDLPGIVGKCQDDPYHPSTLWYEIRNPGRTSRADRPGEILRQRRHWSPSRDQ